MANILGNPVYRSLFLAQTASLVGTGLTTVALALLAFDLAGDQAGATLGTALAIKMIAYVTVAPIATAFGEQVPRRAMLAGLDVARAGLVLFLPFVTQIWQIYLLIFLFQSASAAFTPSFQATIPDVLPEEQDYTRALSLSRLAYDLESLASPLIAAVLLTVISFHGLFAGTAIGFMVSAALVLSVRLPDSTGSTFRNVRQRITDGARIFLATPRLRGLLALSLATSAAGAMVIVNTVVIVQGRLGLPQTATVLALAAHGCGSMMAALLLPRILDRVSDRPVMLLGVGLLPPVLVASAFTPGFLGVLVLWLMLGFGYSMALTPVGRLLRRSASPEDRPVLYAAHFAISHAWWLLCYPLAGWLGMAVGLDATFNVMAGLSLAGLLAGAVLWPRQDPTALVHEHAGLPDDDPHWRQGNARPGLRHEHEFVIDDRHPRWPDAH